MQENSEDVDGFMHCLILSLKPTVNYSRKAYLILSENVYHDRQLFKDLFQLAFENNQDVY